MFLCFRWRRKKNTREKERERERVVTEMFPGKNLLVSDRVVTMWLDFS